MKASSAVFFIVLELIYFGLSEGKVCETDLCKKLANELKISMDTNVDPCEDFSSHICGNFDKLHSIQPGETSYSSMVEIGHEINNILKDLLEKQDISDKNKPHSKAAIFYKSCLNMQSRNKNTKQTIDGFVKKIIDKNDYEDKLAEFLRPGMSSRMMTLYVTANYENPQYEGLSILKPMLILKETILRTPEANMAVEQIRSYKKYMSRILGLLGISNNNEFYINEIVKLHIRLAQSLPSLVDQSNPYKRNNKLTVRKLQDRCPEISWKKLFNNLLSNANKQVTDDDSIMIFSLPYIDKLCLILQEYKADSEKKKILEMDLNWASISALAGYGSDEFIAATEELEREILGSSGKKELWKNCLDLTSGTLTDIMGNMYVKKEFPESKKKDIEAMINRVKEALRDVIEKMTWMDSTTKSAALIKLNSIKYKIGYPESLLSENKLMEDNKGIMMEIDQFMENVIKYNSKGLNDKFKNIGEKIPADRWELGSHQVNAYYKPTSNEIVFPAAILRYPFYDIDLPFTFNYGAIGMVLGHEILHGFDNSGSKYDEKGFVRDWWTAQSRNEYNEKTKCILEQYKGYSIYNESLPSEQTIGEDIADNAGIRMAYMAAFGSSANHEKLTLPGLNFSPEQLFFVAEAKIWCSLYTKSALLQRLKGDVHTIWKFRINGPLSNMPEFTKIFNCDRNKNMNRFKKCLVW